MLDLIVDQRDFLIHTGEEQLYQRPGLFILLLHLQQFIGREGEIQIRRQFSGRGAGSGIQTAEHIQHLRTHIVQALDKADKAGQIKLRQRIQRRCQLSNRVRQARRLIRGEQHLIQHGRHLPIGQGGAAVEKPDEIVGRTPVGVDPVQDTGARVIDLPEIAQQFADLSYAAIKLGKSLFRHRFIIGKLLIGHIQRVGAHLETVLREGIGAQFRAVLSGVLVVGGLLIVDLLGLLVIAFVALESRQQRLIFLHAAAQTFRLIQGRLPIPLRPAQAKPPGHTHGQAENRQHDRQHARQCRMLQTAVPLSFRTKLIVPDKCEKILSCSGIPCLDIFIQLRYFHSIKLSRSIP